MKKLKKALQRVISTRLAKKAPLTKKKSAPVKAAASTKPAKKKAPAKAAAPKKATPDKKKVVAKAGAAKKAEPVKGKKVAAPAAPKRAEKAPEKTPASKALVTTSGKGKKADVAVTAKAKPEAKAPKAEKAKKAEDTKSTAPIAEAEASVEDAYDDDAEIILTDAEGRRYCRLKDCDQISMVDGYCRYHYLLFWKKIQVRKKILTEGKLERYIEELTARYPDKYLEMLRKDLRTEKDFTAAIQELELDDTGENSDYEDSEAQSYLDEVRGETGAGSARDDDSDF